MHETKTFSIASESDGNGGGDDDSSSANKTLFHELCSVGQPKLRYEVPDEKSEKYAGKTRAHYEVVPVIKGDSKEFLIAAASIFAKVVRDKLCDQLDKRFPAYGFGR